MRVNDQIIYEPEEESPPLITLGVALQGVIIVLSNIVAILTTFLVAANAHGSYVTWAVFASLLIGGVNTFLYATRIGRLSPGYIYMMGPATPFIAVCVLAVEEGGLPLMSILILAASLLQFAFAAWLAQLRRIITPSSPESPS